MRSEATRTKRAVRCKVTGAIGRAISLTADVTALGSCCSHRVFKRGEVVFALHDWTFAEVRRGMVYVCPRAWLDEEGKRWIER